MEYIQKRNYNLNFMNHKSPGKENRITSRATKATSERETCWSVISLPISELQRVRQEDFMPFSYSISKIGMVMSHDP